jgi:two-component system response regulator PilR (NtrC family)
LNQQARILVIDDDESIRRTISMALQHAGYFVDTAENGKQAVKKTTENFYNLALIDIRLPDMEGTELLKALPETTPRMIKIILTGFPTLQNAVTAINKGVDAYLMKPVNSDELMRLIREHLDKQRSETKYDQEKLADFVETRLKELTAKELNTQKKQETDNRSEK